MRTTVPPDAGAVNCGQRHPSPAQRTTGPPDVEIARSCRTRRLHATRRWLVVCACGLTATTVCNTGGIVFVGLVVPHLARLLVGPSHRVLLPAAALLGAMLLVASDLVCRLAPPDWNLRLGVVTALLGTPYFLWLLARQRRGELA